MVVASFSLSLSRLADFILCSLLQVSDHKSVTEFRVTQLRRTIKLSFMCVNRSNSINRFRLYSPIHHLRLIHAKLGTRQIIYRSLDLAAGVLSQHNLYGARRNTVRNTRDNFRHWSLDADQGSGQGDDGYLGAETGYYEGHHSRNTRNRHLRF